MLKNRRWLIDLLILLAFSLIPFLWLKPGQAILGHDAGFPLSPAPHFIDRLFLWTHRFGLGNDQTTEVAGFFIHGFEGLISWLGFSLTLTQQITFSTYFFGFALSMYLFARELFPERKNLPLFASFIYMLNHFLLQAWFVIERTKFTLYIALPLACLLFYRVMQKKTSPLTGAILASFVIFFLNGGGFLPLFGAFFITIPFLFLTLVAIADKKWEAFRRGLLFLVLWGLGTALLNTYWIFPYIRFVLTSFSAELVTAGGKNGIVAWVITISEHASFYNLFRFQGIQEWYVNALHPYASTFLNNSLFYFFSHVLPIATLSSVILAKKTDKKLILVFACLFLISMLFMAGSHPPFGFFYLWMIKNIPGFVAFRTPFYKFAPALWLAAAILLGYSADILIESLRVKTVFKNGVVAALIAIWCIYNFPFFTGQFFDYEVGQKTTRVTPPSYVFDYAKWANSNEFPYQRLLLLPGQNPDTHFETYTWGYWSLAGIQGLLNNRSYINNSLYKATTEEIFIKNIYELVERGDKTWIDHAQYLFVDAVLLRKDVNYKLENSQVIDPAILEKQLDSDPRFKRVKEFGPWIVYELNREHRSFAFKDYYYEVYTQNKEWFFEPTTLPGVELDQNTVFVEDQVPLLNNRQKGVIYLPSCFRCLLGDRQVFAIDRNQIVTAGSFFYKGKVAQDIKKIEKTKDPEKKLQLSGETSLKRVFEIQQQFARLAPVEERVIGWQSFVDSLATEQSALQNYLAQQTEFNQKENEFLSKMYENVMQKLQEINFGVEDVNNEDEAALYLQAQAKLRAMQTDLEKVIWYTKDNIHKKYMIETKQTDTFDVWVKNSTFNALTPATLEPVNALSMNVNGQTYPLSQFTPANQGSSSTQWTKLTTVPLNQGMNKIDVQDARARRMLGQNGELALALDSKTQCTDVPLGNLQRDYYQLNLEAYALRDVDNLYIFIDSKDATRPLLPYWGRKLVVDGEKTTYLNFNHPIVQAGDYIVRFCLLGAEGEKHELSIKNFYMERISSPLIAFFRPNTSPLAPPSTLSVDAQKIYPTKYSLELKDQGSSILMFDQRFEPGWEISQNQTIRKHLRVHGYANGWVIEKTTPEPVQVGLEYISQRFYRLGWIVAGTTATLFTIYLAYDFVKKKRLI